MAAMGFEPGSRGATPGGTWEARVLYELPRRWFSGESWIKIQKGKVRITCRIFFFSFFKLIFGDVPSKFPKHPN